MGAMAADLLCEGKTNRVVGYQHGEFKDFDINEALAMNKTIDSYQCEIAMALSR
jgi:6-phosphofructokinase 1